MTAQIKVKVQRKAIVKFKVLPRFPANVVADPGLIITRTGTTYTFSLDPNVTQSSIITPLVIGGTEASSTLTLESTSGAGTSDALQFKTGSQVQRGSINTSGQWTVGPDFAPQPNVLLTINNNTVAPPDLDVPSSLTGVTYTVQIIGADNVASGINMQGFGNTANTYSGISFHRARGAASSRSAVLNQDIVGHVGIHPHSTSDWAQFGTAAIRWFAEENFTDTNQGTSARILTTAVGTAGAIVETVKFLGATTTLGGSDKAAPTAQTLATNSVVDGTSNTAGVSLTFDGSKGTGTGAGGDMVWRLALPGGSGTTQNGLTEVMRLKSSGALNIGSSAAPNPYLLTLSKNTATAATLGGTILQLVGPDSSTTPITLDNYNSVSALGGNNIIFRRTKNTQASPSALTSGFAMGGLLGIGYGATGYIANGATGAIFITAGESWTDTSALTYLQFYTTPTASTTVAEQMRLWGSGGLSVGNAQVGNDPGSGIINAATGYRIGNAATSGNVLRGNGTNFVNAQLGIGDLSTQAAYTLVGNNTSGAAAPTAFTIGGTTHKAVPTGADLILIQDQAASGAFKYSSLTEAITGVAAGVTSIASNTGAFTLSQGITNSTNDIRIDVPYIQNYLSGLTLTYASTTTFTVAAGVATDSTNAALLLASGTLTKSTSAWAVGSGNGGLDTGSIAANTWYHVFLIRRPDTNVRDYLFSTSATAPTMPTNYTQKRRIGSILTNGSSQFIQWIQDGDKFRWMSPVAEVSATNPGTAAVTRTLSAVPAGIRVQADIVVIADSTAGGNPGAIYISDLSATDTAASATAASFNVFAAAAAAEYTLGGPVSVMTNTSAQIRSRVQASAASLLLIINTVGWTDRRGKDG